MADLIELLKNSGGDKGELRPRREPTPRQVHHKVVSVDDHLIEAPHAFEGRLPKAFADRAPRVAREDGADWWVFEDLKVPLLGSEAIQTWEPGAGYYGPVTFEEIRPATWNVHDRVRDMDINGVVASLNFPSAPFGFAGQVFMRMKDRELGLASMRAYNDFVHEEWVSPYPDRIIPCQITWFHDPKVAAAEIERNAARGFTSVSFSENPYKLGLPSIHQPHWDPFLRACEETETVINLHVGSSSETVVPSPDSIYALSVLFPINGMSACADWFYAHIPTRFPKLKVALSEGGIGWVPMMIDRIQYSERYGVHKHFGDDDPVELLHRTFWYTTFSDDRLLPLRHDIGVDRIMFETDYPHTDSSWPDTQELIARQLQDVPADEAAQMTWRNAAELYRLPWATSATT
ncbi:MAG TPA: amidohydrolase family protein [Acidimicrobiales bacterium]